VNSFYKTNFPLSSGRNPFLNQVIFESAQFMLNFTIKNKESQSLLKSGHFRAESWGNPDWRPKACRNPFLNQVIFESVEELGLIVAGWTDVSQSLLKSGHFRGMK